MNTQVYITCAACELVDCHKCNINWFTIDDRRLHADNQSTDIHGIGTDSYSDLYRRESDFRITEGY